MNKKVFIDITELASWQGRLTGVPRVINEVASRYEETENAELVAWNHAAGGYVSAQLPTINDEPAEHVASSSRPSTGKRILKKAVTSNALTRKVAVKAKAEYVRRTQTQKEKIDVVAPQNGDMLLVLADWHGSDQNFIDMLVRLQKKGVVLVQVSHDLIPVVTPQFAGHSTETFRNFIETVYPLCDLILANSQNTKRDIEKYLKQRNLTVPKVAVFRLGDDFMRTKSIKPDVPALNRIDEYLLCVGTIEARKNHTLLYYVYKLAKSRNIKLPPLVIVGRRGYRSEDIYEIMRNDPDTADDFIFMENLSDEGLTWLYEHCLFSLYPSFYEGWGLPIAESLAHGVPCLASNTSSMTEIAGDLLEYFNPFSPEDCLDKIQKLTDKKELRNAIKKSSTYRPTSWDNTYEQIKKHTAKLNEQ